MGIKPGSKKVAESTGKLDRSGLVKACKRGRIQSNFKQ